MGSVSVWAGTEVPEFPRLDRDVRVDVCIVGAGIAGLSAAYEIVRAGRSVVVLDDGAIGSGETGRTTAHLANAIDDRYFEIERLHGEKGAAIAAESHTAAIDRIERSLRTRRSTAASNGSTDTCFPDQARTRGCSSERRTRRAARDLPRWSF